MIWKCSIGVAFGIMASDFVIDFMVAYGVLSAEHPSIGTRLGTALRNWWLRRHAR